MVFGLGWKVFGFCLGFGVESFRIGLKVLGFGGGFFSGALLRVRVKGFEIFLCVLGLSLGFRVLA